MERLIAAIKKEWWVLLNDKVGLLLLFIMPVAMVFIITMVQDSSFEMAKNNQLKVLVVNDDLGTRGDSLVQLLENSGAFAVSNQKGLSQKQMIQELLDNDRVLAIHIPKAFTKNMEAKSKKLSNQLLNEFGAIEEKLTRHTLLKGEMELIYDPVLQENYRQSIASSLQSFVAQIEAKLMIEQLYAEMGFDQVSPEINAQMVASSVQIKMTPASNAPEKLIPNATQHTVPAWTIFAMFFMVISLGANLVRERTKGSYIRLQTIPMSYKLVVISKMVVYFFVAMTQIVVIFSLGVWVFPLIHLPELTIPSAFFPLVVVSVLSAICAISYALLIGTFARTLEQANGIGAISIIIFAAIGGIWVPSFVMPDYLKTVGLISPLHWCLDGFYKVFLEGAGIKELASIIAYFISFITVCWFLVSWKIRRLNRLGN